MTCLHHGEVWLWHQPVCTQCGTELPKETSMDLREFLAAQREDPNLFWRLPSGDHQNLLEEAVDILEAVWQLATVAQQESVPVPADLILARLDGR